MKGLRIATACMVSLVTCGVLTLAQAQQRAANNAGAVQAAQQPAAKTAKSYRRVPRYWGKIGLSDQQRERIYEIQAAYGTRIEKLQEQIEQFKKEQQRACLDLLTAQQRAVLQARLKEAELAKEQRRLARQRKKSQQP